MFEKVSNVLRTLAFVAVIVLCCIRAYTFIHPSSSRPDLDVMAKTLVGTRVDIKSPQQSSMSHSLIIAMSTKCVYCAASAPFYRRIVQNIALNASDVRTIAMFPEAAAVAEKYVNDSLQIKVDEVREERGGKVKATPTIMLVDNTGTVKKAWIGRLRETQEQEVLASIDRLCRTCVGAGR